MDGVFHVHQILSRGACVSLKDLANEIEASERTVQRYIEMLRDRFRVSVVFDFEAGGYRYGGKGFAIPSAQLTEEDLLGLYFAEPILAQYRGTPLEADFARAFASLIGALPTKAREKANGLARRISVKSTVPSRSDTDRFRALIRATIESKQLRVTYYSAHRSATSVRNIDPYALRCVDGRWYVLAYCHDRKAILPFHVDRIWSYGETGKTFEPPDFDPEKFAVDALGIFKPPLDSPQEPVQVVLRFDASAARYVREIEHHPSQQAEILKDGRLEVRLMLAPSVEVERFILSWGDQVEVLAPISLRDRIAARLEQAAGRYSSNKPAAQKAKIATSGTVAGAD